jgi:hypothetical protein
MDSEFDASVVKWKGNAGVVEASTLGLMGFRQAIRLLSPKTGKTLSFSRVRTKFDNDGDVVYVDYINAENNIGVTVFND